MPEQPGLAGQPGDAEFEALLEYLVQARRFDFRGYKRSTLLRRVHNRMARLGVGSWSEYRDYLEIHPEEFGALFDTILINVTSFFRDREAWTYLEREVVPRILAARTGGAPVRVWSAGCASGEEAYSAAILLAEAMGREDFLRRVKVYATDVDDSALAQARTGYEARALSPLDADQRARYFEASGSRFVFSPALRRAVIFGRHDILQDAPISRLDLLICRNTLMYFTPESQSRILDRFRYALNEDGYLFLGKAEMLVAGGNGFVPFSRRYHVFTKARGRMPVTADGSAGGDAPPGPASRHAPLALLAADAAPTAQLVVDSAGVLVSVNQRARDELGVRPGDVGRQVQDVVIPVRSLDLRSHLARAWQQRSPVRVSGLELAAPDGRVMIVDVTVHPLQDGDHRVVGAGVSFEDVTNEHVLEHELGRSRTELESSYEELESTNEELQSAVEELETANEELQSTNEELETMNEELESTNSELQAINTDLGRRQEVVGDLNVFFEAVLGSLQMGVVVVDVDHRVRMWNERARDLWGVDAAEAAGRRVADLDIGLPLDTVDALVGECLAAGAHPRTAEVDAVNRRGRAMRCRIVATPLGPASPSGPGVVLLMEPVDRP